MEGRTLEEIWDGRFYDQNDLVRVGCGGCAGCSDCCQGMEDTIVLDPYDVMRLAAGLKKTPAELFGSCLELSVAHGIILPHLARKQKGTMSVCTFLGENGRCTIHEHRPGFCRLFPLGRYYTEGNFRYILQAGACPKKNKTKVKVKDWLNQTNLQAYETYIADWHYFLLNLQVKAMQDVIGAGKQLSMLVLQTFYLTPYPENMEFFAECKRRMETIKAALA